MVKVAADRSRLSTLDQSFGSASVERRDGLGATPGKRLRLSSRPVFDPRQYFQHFPQARLRTRSSAAVALAQRRNRQPGGLRKLIAADEEAGGKTADVDHATLVHILHGKRLGCRRSENAARRRLLCDMCYYCHVQLSALYGDNILDINRKFNPYDNAPCVGLAFGHPRPSLAVSSRWLPIVCTIALLRSAARLMPHQSQHLVPAPLPSTFDRAFHWRDRRRPNSPLGYVFGSKAPYVGIYGREGAAAHVVEESFMFTKSLLILSAASLLALPAAADAKKHRGKKHHHGYSQRYYGYVSPYYGVRYVSPYYGNRSYRNRYYGSRYYDPYYGGYYAMPYYGGSRYYYGRRYRYR